MQEVHSIRGFEREASVSSGFAPYLAYFLIWMAGYWTFRLSAWDQGLRTSHRPWIYAGLLLILALLILLPLFVDRGVLPVNPSKAAVLTIPFVPIEPTLIPDTLLITHSLNPLSHEK